MLENNFLIKTLYKYQSKKKDEIKIKYKKLLTKKKFTLSKFSDCNVYKLMIL